jgi:hypothetical protein
VRRGQVLAGASDRRRGTLCRARTEGAYRHQDRDREDAGQKASAHRVEHEPVNDAAGPSSDVVSAQETLSDDYTRVAGACACVPCEPCCAPPQQDTQRDGKGEVGGSGYSRTEWIPEFEL